MKRTQSKPLHTPNAFANAFANALISIFSSTRLLNLWSKPLSPLSKPLPKPFPKSLPIRLPNPSKPMPLPPLPQGTDRIWAWMTPMSPQLLLRNPALAICWVVGRRMRSLSSGQAQVRSQHHVQVDLAVSQLGRGQKILGGGQACICSVYPALTPHEVIAYAECKRLTTFL